MDRTSAASLVHFINEHSTSFSAWSLPFAERTWVILRDSRAARTTPCEEPILHVPDYIERLNRRSPHNDELRALLEVWLSANTAPDAAAPPRQPSLGAASIAP